MPQDGGRLVLVVGPSGAGKDTLLAHAASQLADDPRFVFPRRQITRTVDSRSEDHETLSHAEFERLHQSGGCTLSWEAHGLGYVLPKSVMDAVNSGRVAVCNGSRRILPTALAKYPDCKVIVIDADRRLRAARLAARGRETLPEIDKRLARDVPISEPGLHPVLIDNSGDIGESVAALVDALLTIADRR